MYKKIIVIAFITVVLIGLFYIFFPKKYKVYSTTASYGAILDCECLGVGADGSRFYFISGGVTEVCYGVVHSCVLE